MEQLLKITTIPLNYEMKITNARLELQRGDAQMQIHRQRGGMRIRTQPSRLHIDTYNARNSVVPTTKTSIYQAAGRGMQNAEEITARYASEARILMQAKPGEGSQAIDQIIANRINPATGEFQLGFIPAIGADISATRGSIDMRYQMDQLLFDWRINNGSLEYIPGNIEIDITQYPDVQIEYMGSPMYVPPSAAPKFSMEA